MALHGITVENILNIWFKYQSIPTICMISGLYNDFVPCDYTLLKAADLVQTCITCYQIELLGLILNICNNENAKIFYNVQHS